MSTCTKCVIGWRDKCDAPYFTARGSLLANLFDGRRKRHPKFSTVEQVSPYRSSGRVGLTNVRSITGPS